MIGFNLKDLARIWEERKSVNEGKQRMRLVEPGSRRDSR
jgi:hypothetical protein